MKFVVRLKQAHEASGISKYRVQKMTGLSINTIKRYVDDDAVEVGRLAPEVIVLAELYGVDWRDPAIVEVILEEGEERVSSEEISPQPEALSDRRYQRAVGGTPVPV